MPRAADTPKVPESLRPYLALGLELDWRDGKQAVGDCPFCGGENKFTVGVATGLAHCWTCTLNPEAPRGGVNVRSFVRLLWAESDKVTNNYNDLAIERRLLFPETLMHWGTCRSVITGEWLVPGCDDASSVCQLYRWTPRPAGKKPLLLPTPGLKHGLFHSTIFDSKKSTIYVCEGPWDGMALWETLGRAKLAGGAALAPTSSWDDSLLGDADVVAVPGCGTFAEAWLPLFAGKRVVLMYDNDHPTSKHPQPPGLAGMQRAAKMLSAAPAPPASVAYLRWGEAGYNISLPNGWDVRDHLCQNRG